MTDTLLAVEGLSVRYGQALALSNVDVQIGQGEVVAILGSNGAGKSTLGAAVSGLVKPSAGRIRFEGHDVTGWPAHRRARRGIAHVPEQQGVFTGLTVMDNLRASVVRRKRSEQRESIDRAFSLFPVLSQRSRQQAGTLSGGERQMLALARVLASPPRLLVADEMSLGLAPMLVAEVFAGLKRVRDEGVAVLLVEQFVDRAVDLADRALILRRGEVVWQGPADVASGDIVSHYLGTAGAAETELGASAT